MSDHKNFFEWVKCKEKEFPSTVGNSLMKQEIISMFIGFVTKKIESIINHHNNHELKKFLKSIVYDINSLINLDSFFFYNAIYFNYNYFKFILSIFEKGKIPDFDKFKDLRNNNNNFQNYFQTLINTLQNKVSDISLQIISNRIIVPGTYNFNDITKINDNLNNCHQILNDNIFIYWKIFNFMVNLVRSHSSTDFYKLLKLVKIVEDISINIINLITLLSSIVQARDDLIAYLNGGVYTPDQDSLFLTNFKASIKAFTSGFLVLKVAKDLFENIVNISDLSDTPLVLIDFIINQLAEIVNGTGNSLWLSKFITLGDLINLVNYSVICFEFNGVIRKCCSYDPNNPFLLVVSGTRTNDYLSLQESSLIYLLLQKLPNVFLDNMRICDILNIFSQKDNHFLDIITLPDNKCDLLDVVNIPRSIHLDILKFLFINKAIVYNTKIKNFVKTSLFDKFIMFINVYFDISPNVNTLTVKELKFIIQHIFTGEDLVNGVILNIVSGSILDNIPLIFLGHDGHGINPITNPPPSGSKTPPKR